jgi:hypothetical protein
VTPPDPPGAVPPATVTVFAAADEGLLPGGIGAAPRVVISRALPAGSYAVMASITVTGSAPVGSQGEFGAVLSASNGVVANGGFTTPGTFGSARATFQMVVTLDAPGVISLSCWAAPPTIGGIVENRQLMAIRATEVT